MSHPRYQLRVQLSAGNIALLSLFFSACFHSLARYFYTYYRLIFGTLYPSYASFKAIKNKNIKEYARWMMYWVSFGMFSFAEIIADVLFGFWLPFYFEFKILFILWLMSPFGNGAKIMYKHVIHPELEQREQVIDSYIEQAKEVGISSVWTLWTKSSEFLNAAIASLIQMAHAAIVHQLEKSGQTTNTSSLFQSVLPSLLPPDSVPPSDQGSTMSSSQNHVRRSRLNLLEPQHLDFMDSSDVSSSEASNVHISECINESLAGQSGSSKSKDKDEFEEPEPRARVRRRKPLESKTRPTILTNGDLFTSKTYRRF